MYSFVNIDEMEIDYVCKQKLKKMYRSWMRHKYDLLGSGYVKLDYAIKAEGFRGKKYIDRKMEIYGKLTKARLKHKCTASYETINWFVDYKSGFFFSPWKYTSPKRCYQVMEVKEGVEIKCPWELGRFYHLVQLSALAVADETLRKDIIREFRNEITDFIETNPMGKTVQWTAPMDVSIRAVNMLLAYDILTQMDTEGYLDEEFQNYFEQHISKTLGFIMNHLEYTGRISGNHYLSNIAGIIFAAAYLPRSKWTDACMAFGVQELIEQVRAQFYEEGAHFEGSTSYHRLSTEFVLYPTALIYGVLKTEKRVAFLNYDSSEIERLRNIRLQKYGLDRTDFFPEWFVNRLYNAGIFTKICLNDNGEIVQIGDNDSGRLLKLTPMIDLRDADCEENILDHRTLLSAMNGLFANEEFVEFASQLPLESSMIASLSKKTQADVKGCRSSFAEYTSGESIRENFAYTRKTILFQDERDDLLDGVEIYYFEKFGIVVLKGKRLFLSMVIDTARNTVCCGHTHNDKLSIEVMVDGKYLTRDSGTYVYTADTKIRDSFRSTKAHNTICIEGREQNTFTDTWGIEKQARAELLYCMKDRIVARVQYGDIKCQREICLAGNKIVICDSANKPFSVCFKNKIYSDGYGKLKRVEK